MPQLSQQLQEELEAAIARHHLDSVAQVILDNASECYAMIAVGEDDYSEVGSTRFGGDPDLPVDMPWPVHPDSEEAIYCNFIAQINFAELPQLSLDNGLPSHGLLYLFVRYMECAAEPVALDCVYYDGSAASLARRPTPDPEEMCDEYLVDLVPQKIRAVPRISLPHYRRGFRQHIEDNTEEIDGDDGDSRRIELEYDLRRKGQIGQMLGFANCGDERENLYRQIVLERLGKRELVYKDYWDTMEEYEAYIEKWRDDQHLVEMYENMRSGVQWLTKNGKMLAELTDQWKLLFKLDSNSQMNLNINDADPLYVFVKAADLARKCFADLAGEVTQG